MNRSALHESLAEHVTMTYARSGGSGGQNVNKVNTKVHAVINIDEIGGLTDTERLLVEQRLHNSINSKRQICIDVQDERFQGKNRDIALSRLETRIISSAHIVKKRRKTKPTRSSREKRLKSKKIRSELKKLRNGF